MLIASQVWLLRRVRVRLVGKGVLTEGVRVTRDAVERDLSDGRVERIEWVAVTEVEVVTPSRRSGVDEAVIVLAGDETTGALIPWGAALEQGVLERLAALRGFDPQALVTAREAKPGTRTSVWVRR